MSILRRAAQSGRYPQFNSYASPLTSMYGSTSVTSAAGERIDEFTALGISAVLGAVSLLADTAASLPIRTFEIKDGRRSSVPLPDVIANPDPETTTFELIHMIVASLALHGNAYIHLERDARGNLIGLTALHPYQMQVIPGKDQASRTYLHLGNEIPNEDIRHLRWFTSPQALYGISPLNQQRTIMGLSLAMDRHLAQFYGEGATPSSIIEMPGKLTPDQARVIRDNWFAAHNRHRRPAVIADGGKWRPIQVSAADSQMIETREQLIRDVARIYRIPAHLIGAQGDKQTYQNVEQASLNFYVFTMNPWIVRLEKFLSTLLPKGVDVTLDYSPILRPDAMTRARVNQIEVMMGSLNPNEVRVSEGRDPYNGGDVFNQAMPGAISAGGLVPSLGEGDGASSTPVMGVLE